MAGQRRQVQRSDLTERQWQDFSQLMELSVRLKRRVDERRRALHLAAQKEERCEA
jgi:hypothetical protein